MNIYKHSTHGAHHRALDTNQSCLPAQCTPQQLIVNHFVPPRGEGVRSVMNMSVCLSVCPLA